MLFLLYIPFFFFFLAFAPESNSFHRCTVKIVKRAKINFRWKTHPLAFPSTHFIHLSPSASLLEIQLVLRKLFFFFHGKEEPEPGRRKRAERL